MIAAMTYSKPLTRCTLIGDTPLFYMDLADSEDEAKTLRKSKLVGRVPHVPRRRPFAFLKGLRSLLGRVA